jgi:protein ERP2
MVAIPTILTLLGLATTAYSTALTTILTPNERLCFYSDVDKAGEKIGVRPPYIPSTVFIHV